MFGCLRSNKLLHSFSKVFNLASWTLLPADIVGKFKDSSVPSSCRTFTAHGLPTVHMNSATIPHCLWTSYSYTQYCACVATSSGGASIRWPSMHLCILQRKLGFLRRLMYTQSLSVSAKVFLSLKKQGLDPLVVQQCRFLEQAFNTIPFSSNIILQYICYHYYIYVLTWSYSGVKCCYKSH